MPAVPVTTLLLAFAGAVFLFVSLWLLISWWLQRGQQRVARVMPAEDSDPTIVLDDLYAGGGRFGSWERFRRAARGLRRIVPDVDAVLSSGFARSWQTAELLHAEAGWPEPEDCPALEVGHSPLEALDALRGREEESIALVGHEPYL